MFGCSCSIAPWKGLTWFNWKHFSSNCREALAAATRGRFLQLPFTQQWQSTRTIVEYTMDNTEHTCNFTTANSFGNINVFMFMAFQVDITPFNPYLPLALFILFPIKVMALLSTNTRCTLKRATRFNRKHFSSNCRQALANITRGRFLQLLFTQQDDTLQWQL